MYIMVTKVNALNTFLFMTYLLFFFIIIRSSERDLVLVIRHLGIFLTATNTSISVFQSDQTYVLMMMRMSQVGR